ncbi:uncharacterized protein BDZ99DRAFT_392062 [Mytilinidion resinicola]|uniref:Aminoglycoside phosphotransferase domain-containing protein n=1 Tax=Mytilinidion resinicola TaxID=574789 RepID=A0A6A6YGW9_9PEZI|nr:uncharacterized protein BDZ99DRAFT_392062 [Mytilinidion resinicola]KAF2807783.1 hypothetical protein BDZ99DRAFT_392062 [Mytilinidion resinicola]
MNSINLPYFADSASFPAPLPTVQEIESATETIQHTTGRKIAVVGDHFVVKYGVHVDLLEGETTLFLGKSTNVPVPRIYALFQSPDKRCSYIIMERISGWTLDLEWPNMDEARKDAVCSILRAILEEMRKLESPGGYCSIGRRGLPDGPFWTMDPLDPFRGPFDTESDLNEAMIAKYVADGLSQHKANFYSRTFKEVFRNHVPVFAHADLQRKNIMVRFSSKATGLKQQGNVERLELVIIDWEYAGWYPSYWEYARAVWACGRWQDDWNYWIDQILDPFRNEFAWVEMLLKEMWG